MTDPTLFAHIDTALHVIAVIALCALPLLIPLPMPRRAILRRARSQVRPAPGVAAK